MKFSACLCGAYRAGAYFEFTESKQCVLLIEPEQCVELTEPE
jgi:hypothetical protein